MSFLDELSNQIPSGKILSVYSGSFGDSDNEWEWSPEFYKQVSSRVDLIFVPGYDTHYNSKSEYQRYIEDQVNEIDSQDFGTEFIIGIPTHKSSPETIGNALEAFNNAMSDKDNEIVGVAVFAEWTATEKDWQTFDKYFN